MRIFITIIYLYVIISIGWIANQCGLGIFSISIIFVYISTFYISLFCHEFGHALMVYKLGGKILSISARPFQINMKPFSFKINNKSIADKQFLGYTKYIFINKLSRYQSIMVVASGVGAQLLILIIIIFVVRVSLVKNMDGIFEIQAVLLAADIISNVLPFKDNDGSVIIKLILNKDS